MRQELLPVDTTTVIMMTPDDISDLSSALTTPPSSPPSSPLTSLGDSPEIPDTWRDLTPPASQDAGEEMLRSRKRRKVESRPRTTQHLDLTSETAQSKYDREESLDLMLQAIRKREKIVVIAGAGISTGAGIPDFRSSRGLFRSLRREHKLKGSGKDLFDASVYKDDSSTSHFHDMVRNLSTMSQNAKPTRFHHMLARLASEGRLLRLYTQNVDGIETSLPPLATEVPLSHKAPWPKTIQLHGGLEKMMCQKCRNISDFQAQLFEGPTPPACPDCAAKDAVRTDHAGKRSHGVGKLRPRIVLYNEHNPDDEAIGAVTTADFRKRPDAVIVVGTSLKIPAVRKIVREMCNIVRGRRSGVTMWINRDQDPPSGLDLEDAWDLIVKGDSDDVASLAGLREWDDDTADLIESCTESDVERIKSSQGELHVDIDSPSKKIVHDVTAMTPPLSQIEETKVESIPLIFNKTKSQSPAKKSKTKTALKNPASNGRSITDVLCGKENKAKQRRLNGSLKKKTLAGSSGLAGAPAPRIHFKVNKATTSITQTASKSGGPLSPRQSVNTSGAAAGQFSSSEGTPVPESPRSGDWKSNRETISPTGSVPPDIKRLLNY